MHEARVPGAEECWKPNYIYSLYSLYAVYNCKTLNERDRNKIQVKYISGNEEENTGTS
jgi:hypothetical protein